MLIHHFQPRRLQSSNSIFPSYILKFNRMPAVQGLQLKRKSSITQLPHLLESDPRRPPAHVMQRGHGEERAVRQGRHDRPLIPDLPVGRQSPKVHLDVRRGGDDDGIWVGKKIGTWTDIPSSAVKTTLHRRVLW